jgi:hypothetical protein
MLEKDGEDQLGRSCEKCSTTQRQRGKELLTNNNRRKANWIGHILLMECLLKHVIKENMEVTGRRGLRSKQLLDDSKKRKDTGRCKRKYHFTSSGKFAFGTVY